MTSSRQSIFPKLTMPLLLFAVAASCSPPLDTSQLDAAIAEQRRALEEAKADIAKYGKGSALWALASLRAEIYHQSLAMLEQKKASLLPFISLRYTVDGKLYSPPPNKEEQLNGLQEERNKLGAELAKTQQAADGSSGLIGALAAVEYMTKAISLAQLDSRIMTLRS